MNARLTFALYRVANRPEIPLAAFFLVLLGFLILTAAG